MCSTDIEDINKIFRKEEEIEFEKLDEFMQIFLDQSRECTNNQGIERLFNKIKREKKINPSKRQMREIFSKKYKDVETTQTFKRFLVKKAMRSQSGVLVATITLSPHKFSCGYDCYYCPQETDLDGNHTQPRSYMSSEPAMRRAVRHDFDVRQQFWDRINCYISTGNINVDDKTPKKMEVILSGGTWECYPKEERDRFINECYYAANTYGLEDDREILTLEEEKKINELTEYRIIGMTLETRPDFINKSSIRNYRKYGVTRIQIGVQHYDDKILEKINRQCYTKDTIRAIKLLKQVGLKVVVHLMPDLPGSNPQLDKWMFNMAISNPDLQFDDVKIYPTAVCKPHNENFIIRSKISEWYENGEYRPYAEDNIDDLIDVIRHYLININPWVRVQRCIRDIPGCSIESGYQKKSNLRQMIKDKMDSLNEKTFEIRSMEVKESDYVNYPARLTVVKYEASGGIEYHIMMNAFDDGFFDSLVYELFKIWSYIHNFIFEKKLYWSNLKNYTKNFGFLRLRIDKNPGGDIIPEINNTALIREVHVYGNALGVGSNNKSSQHRGYGQYMMSVAEQISRENGFYKTSVIAGIGTREYYKNKCGYHLKGEYMLKNLKDDRFNKYFFKLSILVLVLLWVFSFF